MNTPKQASVMKKFIQDKGIKYIIKSQMAKTGIFYKGYSWLNSSLTATFLLLTLFMLQSEQGIAQNCTVNAGIPRTFCANEPVQLFGAVQGSPQAGTLIWSQISGPSVIINDPTTLNPTITGVVGGNNYGFRVTSRCTDGSLVFDDVLYTISPTPTATASGGGPAGCVGTSYPIVGNTPGVNQVGSWSAIPSGIITIDNPSSPMTNVQLVPGAGGVVTLRWTVTNTVTNCEAVSNPIMITNCGGVSPVSAGPDQVLGGCFLFSTSTTLMGTSAGFSGCGQMGEWTVVSGPNVPNIVDESNNNTEVNNLIQGTYVFRWTVTGPCVSGTDLVEVVVPAPRGSVTNASISSPSGLSFCDMRSSVTLYGSNPLLINETVLWEQIGGDPVTIVSPNSPVTDITGFTSPGNYSFRYSIINTLLGCQSTSTVILNFGTGPQMSIIPENINLPCNQTFVQIPFTTMGVGTNSWRFLSGPGIMSPTTYQTLGGGSPYQINGLMSGTYVVEFRRQANVGNNCPASTDQVTVVTSGLGALANAGTDQLLACNVTTTMLAGNDPTLGGGEGVGTWTQVSGPNMAVISDPHAFDTDISGLLPGQYVFRWIITDGIFCNPNQDDVIVRIANVIPDVVDAGPAQTVCFGTPIQLDGNTPALNEVGTWSVVPSSGVVFSNINDPQSTVTGLISNTVYTFTWTIVNGCGQVFDNVVITTTGTQGPIQAIAGPDICLPLGTTMVTMAGNSTAGGTGLWSLVNGPNTPTIVTPSSPTTDITGLVDGNYLFEWSISRGGCSVTRDTVFVTISGDVTPADAGSDQTICGSEATLSGNTATTGIGSWTQLFGPGGAVITDPTDPNTTVTGMALNTAYTFRWSIENDGCSPSFDDVIIATSSPADPANAGPDKSVCGGNSVILEADPVANGYWTVVTGPNSPTFSDVNSPTATVSGLVMGTYTLRWNSVGGPFCPTLTDEMEIFVVPTANAGNDQFFCDVVSSVTLTGNLASTGVWTQISGPAATLTPTGSNSAVASDLVSGVYEFRYTIDTPVDMNPCSSFDDMMVTILDPPTVSMAGPDQELCDETTFTLAANTPTFGTGTWTVAITSPIGLSGTFTDPNDPTTTFTGAEPGVYIFEWTIANDQCSNADRIRIDNFQAPSMSNAGMDFNNCGEVAILAGNDPEFGLGMWTFVSGPSTPVIQSPILFNTPVTGLQQGVYVFRWTITNGPVCAAEVSEVTITVTDNPTQADAGDPQSLCPMTLPTSVMLDGNTPIIGTGLWTIQSGPMGATFDDPTNPTTNINNLAAGTYVLRWTTTNGPCETFDEVTISVSLEPTDPDVSATEVELCQFEPLFLTGNVPTNGTAQWSFVSGPTTPFILNPNSSTTQVIGIVVGTYEFQYTISSPGCTPKSENVIITINMDPNQAQILMGGNQVLCENTLPLNLNASEPDPGVTGEWSIIAMESAGTATIVNPNSHNTAQITSFSVVGSPSVYRLEWRLSTGMGACFTADTITITVWEEPTGAMVGMDQDLCNVSTFSLTGNAPAVGSGQWTRVSGPNFPTITSPSSASTTISGTVPGTYVFRWTITNGPACVGQFDEVTIINRSALTTSGPSSVTVCDGAAPTLSVTPSGGSGVYTYQWEESTTGCGGPWTPIGGATASTYMTPTLAVSEGTYWYRVVVTDDNGICPPATSDCATVTVVPDPMIDNISSNEVICSGGTAGFTVTASGGTPSLTYQWQYDDGGTFVNVSNGTPTGATYSGATSAALTVNTTNSTPANTYDYRVLVNASGLDCDQAIYSMVTMEVFDDPTISVQPVGDEICPGETSNLSVMAAGTAPGTLVYQWEYNNGGSWENVSNGTPGSVTYSGATSDALDVITTNATSAGNYEYRVVITQAESGCETISDEVTVQVDPIPAITSASARTICNGDNVNYTITSNVASSTYTWTATLLSGMASGFSNGSGNVISQVLTNPGTSPAVVRYTITPTGPAPTSCVGSTFNFDVTIQPTPVVIPTNNATTICSGNQTNITLATSNTGTTPGVTYTWTAAVQTAPSGGSLTGFSNCASSCGTSIAQTISNSGTTPGVVRYTITPFIGACAGSAVTVDVTVNPVAQVNDPADQVVCNGDATTAVVFTTNRTGGTTTYSWTNNTPSIGLAAAGSGDIASFTAVNSGTAPVVATVIVTPMFENNGVSCNGPTQQFTITVNPNGQVNDPADQDVCNGEETTVTFTTVNTGGTTSYAWTNDNTATGLAASGSGNILFNATNAGNAPITSIVTVTPTFSNGGVDCVGSPETFEITVNPEGRMEAVMNQRLCNSESTNEIVFVSENIPSTTTYTWTNDTPSIGLAANGSGATIPSFTAINFSNVPVTANIEVTPFFEGCAGPPESFMITVDPSPIVTSPSSLSICSGENVGYTIMSTVVGTQYTWTASNTVGTVVGFTPSGSGDFINDNLVNVGPSDGAVTYTIFPVGPGPTDCPAPPFFLVVEVINCNPAIGLAKNLVNVTNNGNSTYDITFEFVVRNYGNVNVENVNVTDDLQAVFGADCDIQEILSLTASGLSINPAFDGDTDINLLLTNPPAPATNELEVGEEQSIQLVIRIADCTSQGTFLNSAIATAQTPSGDMVSDDSVNGTDPDPDGDDDPNNNDSPTPVDLECTLFVECPAPNQGIFGCESDIPAGATTVADFNNQFGVEAIQSFCGTIVVSSVDTNNGGTGCASNPLIITRTYTIEDTANGTEETCIITYTVIDNERPTIVSPPTDLILQCGGANAALLASWTSSFGGAVFSDRCDGMPTVSFTAGASTSLCGGTNSTLYTLTVTDACGNVQTSIANVIISDTSAPSLTLPTATNSVDCNDNVDLALNTWLASASATDQCSGSRSVSHSLQNITTTCVGVETHTIRTYLFSTNDGCGNISTGTASFTIIDNTAPVISAPQNLTISCQEVNSGGLFDGLTLWLNDYEVVSSCNKFTVTNDFNLDNLPNTCGETITVTWTVIDDCGATTSSSADLIIENDMVGPTFVNCPVQDITVNVDVDQCTRNVIFSTPIAIDCNAPVSVVQVLNGNGVLIRSGETFPLGTTEIVFEATDNCGNISECTFNITVIDSQLPSIACPSNDVVVCSGGACTWDGTAEIAPTGADNCPGAVITYEITGATTAVGAGSVEGVTFNLGTSTVVYTITVGLETATCSFDVIVEDCTSPMIDSCPAAIVVDAETTSCENEQTLTLPVASDNCSDAGDLIISYIVYNPDNTISGPFASSSNVYIFAAGNSIVEWTVTDEAGNNTFCLQSVNVNSVLPVVNAGSDEAICESNSPITLSGSASNATSTLWITNGSGTFSDATSLTSTYTPSSADINDGQVQLILTATNSCGAVEDFVVIGLWPEITASAGPDATICENENFVITGASAAGYVSLSWATSGDGSFNSISSLNPTYNPGATDIANGSVTLTLTANPVSGSECPAIIDAMVLSIIEVPDLTIDNIVNTQCNASIGSVTLVSPGNMISLNGGTAVASPATFSNLAAGFYQASTTGACPATIGFNIINENSDLTAVVAAQSNVSCFGEDDGSVSIVAVGGSGSYTFVLNEGTPQANGNFSNLAPGTYTVLITDGNGCTYSVGFGISQPTPLVLNIVSQTNVTCFEGDNGSATVSATGGVGPYTFSIASEPVGSTAIVNGNVVSEMIAGTYTIEVEDGNGCSTDIDITITQPIEALVSVISGTNISCLGGNDGSATIIPSGGTGPYTVLWSTGSTNFTEMGLSAGIIYGVSITDANGCMTSNSIELSEPASLVSASIDATNPNCDGGALGTATAFGSGGTPGYTYLWSNGETTAEITGLTAGTYTVTVTDLNGCTADAAVVLNDPTGISAQISAFTNNSCFESNDGTATVTAVGGSNYSYSWSTNPIQTGMTATDLAAGIYTVTVTDDDNNCTAIATVQILEPTPLEAQVVSVNNTSCDDAAVGSATVSANGGTTPYSFQWPASAGSQTEPTAIDLSAGSYIVTVTDANMCLTTVTVTINSDGDLAIAAINDIGPLCLSEEVGSILLSTIPANSNVVFTWTGGAAVGLADGSSTGLNPNIPAFTASNMFGSETVTVTATLDGCSSSTTFDILIDDSEDPVFVNCPSGLTFTIGTDNDCENGVIWSIPIAEDNCGAVTVVETTAGGPLSGTQLTPGSYTIEYTATDGAGNQAICTFEVIIVDDSDPLLVCPSSFTVGTDTGVCSWTSEVGELNPLLSVDNCPGQTLTYVISGATTGSGTGNVPITTFNQGVSTITYTLTDGVNTVNCSFNVTVLDDESPVLPAAFCNTTYNVTVDADACVSEQTYDIGATTDNCVGALTYEALVLNPNGTFTIYNTAEFTHSYAIGISEVTVTSTDAAGNSRNCTFTVVVTDNQSPSITCPTIAASYDNTAGVCGYVASGTEFDATATDNCGVVSLTHNYGAWGEETSLAGATFPVGSTTVIWTAVDASGNETTCEITIVVTDEEAPVFVNCPQDVTFTVGLFSGDCESGATWSIPVVGDNCGVATLVQTEGPTQGSILAVGTYLIEYTATDAAGNATTCSFTIEVIDTEDPVIVCPGNVVINNTDADVCTWTAPVGSLSPLLANGNCDYTITWEVTGATTLSGTDDVSGETFNEGVSTVTYTITEDASGQTWECSFTVTVNDTQAPIITCPAAVASSTDTDECAYAYAPTLTDVTATDNCSDFADLSITYQVYGPDNSISAPQANGSSFNFVVGISQVEYTVIDEAGNISTCIQSITITDDQSPVITCPTDVDNFERINTPDICGYIVNGNEFDATATDNCGIVSLTHNFFAWGNPNSLAGAELPVGITTILWTAIDAAGNSTTCSIEVTVTGDQDAFFVNCPQDTTFIIGLFDGDCEGGAIWSVPVARDNCGQLEVVQTAGPPQGSVLAPGIYTIEYTATDALGNPVICSFNIEVIDSSDPIIVCPSNIIIGSTDSGECVWSSPAGSLTPLLANSNCPYDVTWVVENPDGSEENGIDDVSGYTFSAGVSLVTYTITDVVSNQIVTCSFTVDVIDEEPPVIDCPETLVLECASDDLEAQIEAWIGEASASDNCDTSVDIVATLFSTDSQCGVTGTRLYRFVATDSNQNTSECYATVIITDNTPPVISGGENQVVECVLGGAGNDSELLSWLNNNGFATATDLCGNVSWSNDFNEANWVDECENLRYIDVTFTATDDCGNSSNITLRFGSEDSTPPVFLNCPRPDIVVKSGPGMCGNFVNFSLPIAIDNCDLLPTINKIDQTGLTSGDFFPLGRTVLVWEAIDCSGNSTICEINIYVNDDNPPSITCPADITLLSNEGCNAEVPLPLDLAFSDLCEDNLILIYKVESPLGSDEIYTSGVGIAEGFLLPVGVHELTYKVLDQPLLLITEVTQELQGANGGTNPVPGFFNTTSGDDYIEITNFGQASLDIGGLVIERLGTLSDPSEEIFIVPNGTILDAGEVFVLHYGLGVDDPINHFYNLPNAADINIEIPAAYVISIKGRVIDMVAVNGFDANGQGTMAVVSSNDWTGSVPIMSNQGSLYRYGVWDSNQAEDWAFSDIVNEATLGTYNTSLPAVDANGSTTSLHAQAPNMASCSFIITVEDNELPTLVDLLENRYTATNNIGQGIGSLSIFTSIINVPDEFNVASIAIENLMALDIPLENLTINLISPSGTQVTLYSGECSGQSDIDLGFSEESNLTFNPSGCSLINNGFSYIPFEPFSGFFNESSLGDWTLQIINQSPISGGSFEGFDLILFEATEYDQEDVQLVNDPGQCGASFTWIHPCLFDICSLGTFIVTLNNEDGTVVIMEGDDINACESITMFFPIGVTNVEYQLIDGAGNTVFFDFNVEVIDVEAPLVTCPDDVTIELEPGECSIAMSFIPQVIDNCTGWTVTTTPEPNHSYEIGTTLVEMIVTDPNGLTDTCTFMVTVEEFGDVTNNWSCVGQLNVSLGPDCMAEITPAMFLTGGPYGCYDNYTLTIGSGTPDDFQIIPTSPFVTLNEVNQLLVVMVTDPVTGNTCWGNLLVENKRDPEILCPADITVECNAETGPEFLGEVELLSCVPNASMTYEDEEFIFEECGDPRAQIIRTWTVTDISGRSSTCVQNIDIKSFDLVSVVYPENYDGVANPVFDCVDVAADPMLIHPNNTGRPTINDKPVVAAHYCESSLSYTDERFDICGSSYEILRTWKVRNMCLPLSEDNPRTQTQIIKVLDRRAPEWTCVDTVFRATSPFTCDVIYDAEANMPDVMTNCSGIDRIQIIKPKANNRYEVGSHEIRYIAIDSCGNRSSCTVTLIVEDRIEPVAVCETYRVVSLGGDCTGRIPASAFDDGSYDNCGIVRMQVARMTPSACYDIPEYGNNPASALIFRDSVEFCCVDLMADETDRRVILRITDEAGNTSECMVFVEAQDKLRPTVICPPSITVDCQQHFDTDPESLNELFGRIVMDGETRRSISEAHPSIIFQNGSTHLDGVAFDNCINPAQGCTVDVEVTMDMTTNCAQGTISRVFTITDQGGNTDRCVQIITLQNTQPFDPLFFRVYRQIPGVTNYTLYPDGPYEGTNAAEFGITGKGRLNLRPIATTYPTRFDIVWPADLRVDFCGQALDPEILANDPALLIGSYPYVVRENICSNVGMTYDEWDFDFEGGCKKIIRRWKVIDWCQESTILNPWTWEQTIEVIDEVAPEISSNEFEFCLEGPCDDAPIFNLKAFASDNCASGQDLRWDWEVYPFGDRAQVVKRTSFPGQTVSNGPSGDSIIVARRWPVNDPDMPPHVIRYIVDDGCGNVTSAEFEFTINDCKKPTPVCYFGLTTDLHPVTASVEVAADLWDAGSFDNCTVQEDLIYRVERTSDSDGQTVPSATSLTFNCEDLGRVDVLLWVGDEWGNWDFCQTFIVVENNMNADCPDEGFDMTISGRLHLETGVGVEDAIVHIGLADNLFWEYELSNVDGEFTQGALEGLRYEVRPERDDNPRNGVSTMDLLLIQRHILGVQALNSPYKRIAADADRSEQITGADLVTIRRVLLGINDRFTNNTSWRFVDADYDFPDPTAAESEDFPDYRRIDSASVDVSQENFIAVKIGDVNNTATANSAFTNVQVRNQHTLTFVTDDETLIPGKEYIISFRPQNFEDITGYQFTLDYRTDMVDFAGLGDEAALVIKEENYGTTMLDQGIVTTSWHSRTPVSIDEDDTAFTLRFRAKKFGKLSEAITFNSRFIRAEAYTEGDREWNVDLRFAGEEGEAPSYSYELFQNVPNPWQQETLIGFTLPFDMEAGMTVFDVSGRVIHKVEGDFAKGYNEIRMKQGELPQKGILFYRLETKDFNATKKMILID